MKSLYLLATIFNHRHISTFSANMGAAFLGEDLSCLETLFVGKVIGVTIKGHNNKGGLVKGDKVDVETTT